MGTVNPQQGKKGIHLSLSQEALQLLEDNGITERKRGKTIEDLIFEKYRKALQTKTKEMPKPAPKPKPEEETSSNVTVVMPKKQER